MYAPFTPIEFFDASFHDGSEHTLWCLRVTGAVRFAKVGSHGLRSTHPPRRPSLSFLTRYQPKENQPCISASSLFVTHFVHEG
jgi:hypothetical protein